MFDINELEKITGKVISDSLSDIGRRGYYFPNEIDYTSDYLEKYKIYGIYRFLKRVERSENKKIKISFAIDYESDDLDIYIIENHANSIEIDFSRDEMIDHINLERLIKNGKIPELINEEYGSIYKKEHEIIKKIIEDTENSIYDKIMILTKCIFDTQDGILEQECAFRILINRMKRNNNDVIKYDLKKYRLLQERFLACDHYG